MSNLIILQMGEFADGKATPCYQLAALNLADGTYHTADLTPNDPVILEVAQARLKARLTADLREEFFHEVPTLEAGKVGVSAGNYGDRDGDCCLLQIGLAGHKELLCVYLAHPAAYELGRALIAFVELEARR